MRGSSIGGSQGGVQPAMGLAVPLDTVAPPARRWDAPVATSTGDRTAVLSQSSS